jgi:hypothetical protein
MSTYRDEATNLDFEGELITSAQKAIRAKCLDCCCGQKEEVKLCTSNSCPLWPFRSGKNPYKKKKEFTEEQLEERRARMKKLHAAKKAKAAL